MKPYKYIPCSLDSQQFLKPLKELFTDSDVSIFLESERELTRANCEGAITVKGKVGGLTVGVIYNDFRVNGGAFCKASSRRMNAFIEELGLFDHPLVMVFNTIGVGIMEGRTVFNDAFGLMPALFKYRKNNLLVTCATGRCLGLGEILFGMGHYRLAVKNNSVFNLTGPEVMRLFFGVSSDNFETVASAQRQFEKNELIHELHGSQETAFAKIRFLFTHISGSSEGLDITRFPSPEKAHGEYMNSSQLNQVEKNLHKYLSHVGERSLEVLEQMSPIVRTFIVRRGEQTLGVFINPPGHPNNMVDVSTLRKYQMGLDLFKSLRIPIISILDTPGIDPRVEQQDQDVVRYIVEVADRIIHYPFGVMGICAGRSYGGATTLGFPLNFKTDRCIALKTAQLGIMGDSILEKVLENSPRLLENWRSVREAQPDDASDLVESGAINAMVDESELPREIELFLSIVEEKAVREVSVLPEERRLLNRPLRPILGELSPLPVGHFLPEAVPTLSLHWLRKYSR